MAHIHKMKGDVAAMGDSGKKETLFELGRVCVKSAIRQDAIHILS